MFPGTRYSGDVEKHSKSVVAEKEEAVEMVHDVQEDNKTRLSPQEAAYVLDQVTKGYSDPIWTNVKYLDRK